jgi:predicted nucleic acid-binding protein
MKVTFMDSGALIAAARGEGPEATAALAILDDPDRVFASSPFVRMEALPKATYHRRMAEVDFYEAYFSSVTHWAGPLDQLVEEAHLEACRLGLAAIDALHVTAATLTGADELVTSESTRKSIHRATTVKVVSLRSLAVES